MVQTLPHDLAVAVAVFGKFEQKLTINSDESGDRVFQAGSSGWLWARQAYRRTCKILTAKKGPQKIAVSAGNERWIEAIHSCRSTCCGPTLGCWLIRPGSSLRTRKCVWLEV